MGKGRYRRRKAKLGKPRRKPTTKPRDDELEEMFKRVRREAQLPYLGGDATITITPNGQKPVVLSVKGYTLDISRDYVDATVFGSVNKTYLAGTVEYTIKAW